MLVAGYYGMGNFGDDLFADTLAHLLSPRRPRFMVPHSDELSVRRLSPVIPSRLYAREGKAGALVRGIASATVPLEGELLLGGGSLLHGESRFIRSLIRRHGSHGLPILGVGVSVGPFNSLRAREGAIQGVHAMCGLAVRDQASLLRVQSLGLRHERVVLMGDLVALNARIVPPVAAGTGLVVVPCKSVEDERMVQACLRSLEVTGGSKVKLLCLNDNKRSGDARQVARLAYSFRNRGLIVEVAHYSELGISATLDVIAAASCVVSGRLHGAVVAYLLNKPFKLLQYHEKCREFLSDVQSPDTSVPAYASVPVDKYRDRARRGLERALGWLDERHAR